MKLLILTILIALFGGGCQSANVASRFPCFDAWSVTASGSTALWNPSPEIARTMLAQIPPDQVVACWHKDPSGLVTLLAEGSDKSHNVYEFSLKDGKYGLVSTGFIVTAD